MRVPFIPEHRHQSLDRRQDRDASPLLRVLGWTGASFLFVYLGVAAAVGVLAR